MIWKKFWCLRASGDRVQCAGAITIDLSTCRIRYFVPLLTLTLTPTLHPVKV